MERRSASNRSLEFAADQRIQPRRHAMREFGPGLGVERAFGDGKEHRLLHLHMLPLVPDEGAPQRRHGIARALAVLHHRLQLGGQGAQFLGQGFVQGGQVADAQRRRRIGPAQLREDQILLGVVHQGGEIGEIVDGVPHQRIVGAPPALELRQIGDLAVENFQDPPVALVLVAKSLDDRRHCMPPASSNGKSAPLPRAPY